MSSHGTYAYTDDAHPPPNLMIAGGAIESDHRAKLMPWTEASGRKIDDHRVLQTYADETSAKTRTGPAWLLRLAHYRPRGEMKFSPGGSGCMVEFQLYFETNGVAVLGILPVEDVQWAYRSNGRMEREYLDGISAELIKQKSHTPAD